MQGIYRTQRSTVASCSGLIACSGRSEVPFPNPTHLSYTLGLSLEVLFFLIERTPHMPSEVLLQNLLKPDTGLHSIQIIVFYIFWLFHYK